MDHYDVAAMRTEYAEIGLDEQAAGTDPVDLFTRWMADAIAAGLHEPNAMALATAGADGAPAVRIVLLKAFDRTGAVFYTNYASRKGRDLEANPRAALALLWHPLQRQVRIEGGVERLSPADNAAYFGSRPRGSQLGAVASPQSHVVADRAELEHRYQLVEEQHPDQVPCPDSWGGYRVRLDSVEFWQGRSSRMHDRIRFRAAGGDATGDATWTRERLAP